MKNKNWYKELKFKLIKGMAMGLSLSLFIPCVNSNIVYGAENDVEDTKIETVADSVYGKDRVIDDETLLDITEEVEIVSEENEEIFSNFEDLLNQYEEYLEVEATKAIDEIEERVDDKEFNDALVKWKFINKLGPDYLNSFKDKGDDYQKFISVIMKDTDLLNEFVQGRVDLRQDRLRKALEIWKKIWEKDKDSHDGFYRKLAIATALAHSKPIKVYGYHSPVIDPVGRYELYKELNEEGKLLPGFEDYDVTHLTMIVNNRGSEEDINWAQSYVRAERPEILVQKEIKRFGLKVPYGRRTDKGYNEPWTLKDTFIRGGVCQRISNVGVIGCQTFGVPSTLIHQPGHAAYLYMPKEESWTIANNITGFGGSKITAHTTMPWGNHPSYIILLEDAYKDKADLEKSQKFLWLTDIVDSSSEKLKISEQAVEVQPLNYFAWQEKINYLLDVDTSEKEWRKITFEVIETFSKYPKVMVDLLDKFENHIPTEDRLFLQEYVIRLTDALNEAGKISNYPLLVRNIRNDLLAKGLSLATFSFDGENAGRLMGIKTDVEYSLDGGITYKTATEEDMLLSDEELKSITAENNILLRIKGADSNVVIPISKYTLKSKKIKTNDTLNTITGLDNTMEFSVDNKETWTRYKGDNLPDLTGNVVIHVRKVAKGTYLPSNIVSKRFTAVTFSFDGKYAGRLMGGTLNTEYSLDGGVTYKTVTEKDMLLSDEELKSITAKDGMLIRIKGTEDTQLISFKTQGLWQSTIKGNDKLNTLTGLRTSMEFSIDGKKTWTRYNGNNLPDLTGNIIIHVRKAAKGTYLPGSIVTRKFTGSAKVISASFSFDGENRGRLIGATPDAEYSLDGGKSYNNVTEENMLLSEEEIKSITAQDGILLRNKGTEDTYLIAIEEGILSEDDIEANDKLDTLLGINESMEFKVDDQESWIRYQGDNLPELTGHKTIYIRKIATGTQLPSNVVVKNFTSTTKISSIRFSFDGENKGKLMGAKLDVEYSLDGGKSYKNGTEENMLLSEEELKSITAQDGILLRIKGTEDTYLISIQKRILHTRLIKANDRSNTLTGIRSVMEFSVDNKKTWTRYNGKNLPDLSGNVTIHIRKVATGRELPSNIVTRKFTN